MNLDLMNLQDYTVKILCPNKESTIGTGFFIHPDGYILTGYHVIEPYLCKNETGQFDDIFRIILKSQTEQIEGLVIHEYCLKERDIAVLKIKNNSSKSNIFSYLPLDIHNERWTTAPEKFTSFGHPEGQFKDAGIQVTGEISGATNIDNIPVCQIGGFSLKELASGSSGSPVICVRTKKVIGLIYATYHQENLAFFAPISGILNHWEKTWKEMIEFHDVYKRIQKEIYSEACEFLEDKLKNSPFIPLDLQRGDILEKKKKKTTYYDDFQKSESKTSIHHRVWHNFSVSDLLPPTGSYLLSANVGFGKTTFLHWLTSEINKKQDNLAIFIECSKFSDWNPESWEDLKQKIFNAFKPRFQNKSNAGFYVNDDDIKDCLDFYFNSKKVIFLYDGLDQISVQSPDHSKIIKSMLRIAGQNKVIISSRPSALIKFEEDPSFIFLRLMPFSKEDEIKYFGEYYGTISSVRSLAPELKSVPMLAFMIKVLAMKGKINEVKNRADLYDRFIDHILIQQNRSTPDGQSLKVQEELEKISFESLHSAIPSIQIIPANATYIDKERISIVLKFGLVNLILEDGKQSLFFTHTSFQEFLAAKFIAKSDRRDKYIQQITSEREILQKREVIRFLAGMLGNIIISDILAHKVSSWGPNFIRTKTGDLIFRSIESLSQFIYKPLLPNSNLFLAAEILPEVKKIDITLYQKIYWELHGVRNSKTDKEFYIDNDFVGALIYLSRGQGIPDVEIKKIVVDIINCVTINEVKRVVPKDEGFEELSELINDNDSIFLKNLSPILSIQKDSIRSIKLEVYKEDLLKNP